MAKAIKVKDISEFAESYIEENYSEFDPYDGLLCEAINTFVDALLDDESMSEDTLPESRWRVNDDGSLYCGRCKHKPTGGKTKYCPECGARMKG